MMYFSETHSFNDEYLAFVLLHFEDIQCTKTGNLHLTVSLANDFCVSKKENEISITLVKETQLFYAVSLLLANAHKNEFTVKKTTPFSSVNFMVDCSRAAVLNVPTVKKLVILLAKLGYTGLELYTEDTYEITEEPYFGHLRGKYTKEEIREIDSFAKQYGIELIPCIQTLAHLDNIFLWPKLEAVHDIWDCLTIGNEKTYDLIEKMFKNIADSFSSRLINIGYDEAYYAGRGAYLDKNGYRNRSELLFEHLKKVTEIGKKYGFKCIVYSDMFFHNQDTLKGQDLPENLEFNYWNYYRTDKRIYDKAFESHLKILSDVDFTAGAWKWLGHTPFNRYGMKRMIPGVKSASEHGIKTITLSAWGDNGNECSLFAVLPQIICFSILALTGDVEKEILQSVCESLCGITMQDLLKLDVANGHKNPKYTILTNPAKYLLYNDPLCGLMDKHVDETYNAYYKKCVQALKTKEKRSKEWAYLFNVQIALCDYLSVKANMGNDLYKLYNSHDNEGLNKYIKTVIPRAKKKLEHFIFEFRNAWYKENKTFGFDVMEQRLGGQMQRLKEIEYRVNEYILGKIDRIEELEQPKLPYNYPNEKGLVYKHNSKFIISPFYPVI